MDTAIKLLLLIGWGGKNIVLEQFNSKGTGNSIRESALKQLTETDRKKSTEKTGGGQDRLQL